MTRQVPVAAETALLFAYGTLRKAHVQRIVFGRLLEGRPDALPGYVLAPLTTADPQAIAISGGAVHTIARPTGDPTDLVPGLVFGLSSAELAAADAYEVEGYARIAARLASGAEAFVYVGAQA